MKIITKEYLLENPNHIFVFGDNLLRIGTGGAASLRDLPNTYGFVTKKAPNNNLSSFYTPKEYEPVFADEMNKLIKEIENNPDKTYLISKVGAGLANYHAIFETVIKGKINRLKLYKNVEFLF